MKKWALWILLSVMALLLIAAASNRTPLLRAFLQSNMDGNVLAITNLSDVLSAQFHGDGSGLTNLPTGAQTNVAWVAAGSNVVVLTNVVGIEHLYTVSATATPGQTNWPLSAITNAGNLTNWALIPTNYVPVWAQNATNATKASFVDDVSTNQIAWAQITNVPPDVDQTNWSILDITNSLNLTNWALLSTNILQAGTNGLGFLAFSNSYPAQQTNWPLSAITNANNLTNWASIPTNYVPPQAGHATNADFASFVGNISSNQIPLSGVTNAANLTNWALLSTNTFLNKAGDTATGPILSSSSSTNAPSATEFATAAWVRSLLSGGVLAYASTNIDTGTNADSPNQFLYQFSSAIPQSAVRTWATAFLTNGGYVGSVVTTNTIVSLQSPVVVNAYIGMSSGGSDAVKINPEIYYSYDKTNWSGDFDCQAQSIIKGATNLYQFVITFPAVTATNTTGFYLERRLRVSGVAGTPTIYFMVGTNAVSGTNNASHIAYNVAAQEGGNFVGTFSGNGLGITNIYGSNVVSGGTIPAAAMAMNGTNTWTGTNTFTVGTRTLTHDGSHTVITNTATLTSSEWTAGQQKEWYNGTVKMLFDKTNGNIGAAGQYSGSGYGLTNLAGQRRPYYSLPRGDTSTTSSQLGGNWAASTAGGITLGTATSDPAILVFTTAVANANNAIENAVTFSLLPATNGYFVTYFALTNTSNVRFYVGYCSVGTHTLSAQQSNSAWNIAALRFSTNSANWFLVTSDGSATLSHWQEQDTGVPASTSKTLVKLLYVSGGAGLTADINGTRVAVTNTSYLPTGPVSPGIGVCTLTTATNGFNFYGLAGENDWQ